MHRPLNKHFSVTYDSFSFQNLDLSMYCEVPVGEQHPGAFGYIRQHHIHEGVDLYGYQGDVVHAMVGGIVVAKGAFTGQQIGTPWWHDTDFIAIEDQQGVTFYGEISVDQKLNIGDIVRTGRVLGTIKTVLKTDKGRPMSMLHIERYTVGTRQSCNVWDRGNPFPVGLIDPTSFIMSACGIPRSKWNR